MPARDSIRRGARAALAGARAARTSWESAPAPAPDAAPPPLEQTEPWRFPAPRAEALDDALRARTSPANADPLGPVTRGLYERLTAEDVAALEARIDDGLRPLWEQGSDEAKMRLALVFSAWYELPGAARAGLHNAMPPEAIHAMARGPIAAGGDPWSADIVFGALEQAGVDVPDGATVVDFGCSSGRVLRTVAAWRPDLRCLGCDPNADAIAWASEHLAPARFFVSPTEPPLELDEASVDVVYAISVWSHFDAQPALDWLEEMHRVIKPGGALVLTVHGYDALAVLIGRDHMTRSSAAEVAEAFVREGHHYFDVFGEDGDWGVKAAGWGNGYMTVDWLAARVTPAWSIALVQPGALHEVQDVIVLVRR